MAKLINFYFTSDNYVTLEYDNNHTATVLLNEHSGKPLWRYKIDTISKVKHTGIYLGVDYYTGEPYVVHNHYKLFGTAGISTLALFESGMQSYWIDGQTKNDWMTIVSKSLREVIREEPYKVRRYNCQTLVNIVCNNVRRSEDVEKWAGIALGLGTLVLISRL